VADTIDVETYKEQYKKIMDTWAKDVKEPFKRIEEVSKELDLLDAKTGGLSDDEKKRHKELTAQRKRSQDAVESANFELKENLLNIKPLDKATKDEMHELLKWMKAQYEKIKKGLPLSDRILLKPDTDFDLKKMKLKGQGVILEWKF
jgi:hypothetical protein